MNDSGKRSSESTGVESKLPTLRELLDDSELVKQRIQAGIDKAIDLHYKLGLPIVVCENGEVIEDLAENIYPEKYPKRP